MRLMCEISQSMGENCYFVVDESTNKAIVIDPGENGKKLNKKIDDNNLKVVAICLTHCHFDHIGAVAEVKAHTNAPVFICSGDEKIAENPVYNLSSRFTEPITIEYDRVLQDGEKFAFGNLEFETIITPGHTPGCGCFYFEREGVLFSGDTLFYMSYGRTDFPMGSSVQITKSIKEKLFVLPDYVKVYSGHGQPTEIGFEKKNNMYINV